MFGLVVLVRICLTSRNARFKVDHSLTRWHWPNPARESFFWASWLVLFSTNLISFSFSFSRNCENESCSRIRTKSPSLKSVFPKSETSPKIEVRQVHSAQWSQRHNWRMHLSAHALAIRSRRPMKAPTDVYSPNKSAVSTANQDFQVTSYLHYYYQSRS